MAADLGPAGAPIPIYAPHPALPVPCKIMPLAAERVRFVGEPVAVVIAEDVYRAWDALDLIRVEYEPLPAVVDVEAALAPGAPILHEEIGSNVVAEWRQRVGDVDEALRTAPVDGARARPPGAGRRAPARAALAGRRSGRTRGSPCGARCRWSTATAG